MVCAEITADKPGNLHMKFSARNAGFHNLSFDLGSKSSLYGDAKFRVPF